MSLPHLRKSLVTAIVLLSLINQGDIVVSLNKTIIKYIQQIFISISIAGFVFIRRLRSPDTRLNVFDTQWPIYFCAGVSLNNHSFIHSYATDFKSSVSHCFIQKRNIIDTHITVN